MVATSQPSASVNGQQVVVSLPGPGTWVIDAAHTGVEFIATHLLVGKVRGRFGGFEGRVVIGERPEVSSVIVSVDAASVATGIEARDNHLRGGDFLDAAGHPTILFVSRSVSASGDGWAAGGELTLKGITRPATFHVTYHGTVTDPRGAEKALFSAVTEIDREAFGLRWNQPLPGGGLMIGTTVRIEIEGQAIRAPQPSLYEIARSLEPVIRQYAEQMERERTIPPVLVDLLYESGVFRAFLPRELGGLEVNPVEWLEMVEELSRIDGSVGWLAMINAGGTRLKAEPMRAILAEKGRWITTSNLGRIGGKARRVEGGYRITGRWPFSSGAPHSVFMAGQAIVHDENDEMLRNADGQPLVIGASWPAEEGRIVDTWDGLGLRGTGSHDVEVTDLFVPDAYIAENPRERPYPGPLYKGQFLLMAHAAHAVGIARAAIDALIELCNAPTPYGSYRQSSLGKMQLHHLAVAKADALVRAARLFAWDATARAYASASGGGLIPYEQRILLAESMIFAVQSAKQAVNLVFEASGASGVYHGTVLERCFRDIHTAAQHIIVTENRYESVGQFYITKDQPGGAKVEGLLPF